MTLHLRWALAAVSLLGAQQRATIRVPVRLVAVPTLVLSNRGRVIDRLDRANFHLYDNNCPQTIRLETATLPLAIVLVIQINDDVREYLPFISKVGSVVDTMLVAQTGEAAVITYNDDVTVRKPFNGADVQPVLKTLVPAGQPARMIDAGLSAISLLKGQPGPRSRVLLFIGQPADHGSHAARSVLEQRAETDNVSIYSLTLPQFGKSFASDSFHLSGFGSQSIREVTRRAPTSQSFFRHSTGALRHWREKSRSPYLRPLQAGFSCSFGNRAS